MKKKVINIKTKILRKSKKCKKCKDGRMLKKTIIFCSLCGHIEKSETKEIWITKKVTEKEYEKIKARTCSACERTFKSVIAMRQHYKRKHFN